MVVVVLVAGLGAVMLSSLSLSSDRFFLNFCFPFVVQDLALVCWSFFPVFTARLYLLVSVLFAQGLVHSPKDSLANRRQLSRSIFKLVLIPDPLRLSPRACWSACVRFMPLPPRVENRRA